jgi:hypothetical protein
MVVVGVSSPNGCKKTAEQKKRKGETHINWEWLANEEKMKGEEMPL